MLFEQLHELHKISLNYFYNACFGKFLNKLHRLHSGKNTTRFTETQNQIRVRSRIDIVSLGRDTNDS